MKWLPVILPMAIMRSMHKCWDSRSLGRREETVPKSRSCPINIAFELKATSYYIPKTGQRHSRGGNGRPAPAQYCIKPDLIGDFGQADGDKSLLCGIE